MFVEAYVDVSREPCGWLWSAQLLLWVTVACAYLYYEGVCCLFLVWCAGTALPPICKWWHCLRFYLVLTDPGP